MLTPQAVEKLFVTLRRLCHAAYSNVEMPGDDYAAMLAALEERMLPEDIAVALEVDEQVLDEIASGYVPDEHVAARLKALTAAGGEGFALGGQRKLLIIAFVAIDLVTFAIVAALVLLR